ncbi:MAG: nucleotidyltransferase family protein [Nannocystaceae bacterium]
MARRLNALVPCAGFGTRLGGLCEHTPKPLLTIGDRSIVEHILDRLARAGVTDVWINVHYLADRFASLAGPRRGVNVHVVHETAPRGTAGTVRDLAPQLGEGDLLVHYGDVLTEHDLGQLLARHREREAWATALVHQRVGANSRAVLDDDDRVVEFIERPAPDHLALVPWWAFSGVCVLSARARAAIPALPITDLPAHVFPILARAGRLWAQRLDGFRVAVDSPARLELARHAHRTGAFASLRSPSS